MAAQVLRPEEWQEGIQDNALLPNRYTQGLFLGSEVKIANNNDACRIWTMVGTDYITDYTDKRINGLLGRNSEVGVVGGASAYGTFQDVRFVSRVYTMGRHRSVAMRLYDEIQYAGGINEFGTATTSNAYTAGNSLLQTAQMIKRAMDLWQKQVLGPDIDKYSIFCAVNGHISGRWVQDDPDRIFNDQGTWVAQPGTVQGEAIPPRFAAIHAIEWDDDNIPLMLSNLKVTWNNLMVPQDNRVIVIDPLYEYRLLRALTGGGVPATEAAYADMQNGSFTKLMGWNFRFDIPSDYWPHIWLDDNMNVVHSEKADAAYDKLINSVSHAGEGDKQLYLELVDANRPNATNFIRTVFDEATGTYKQIVTNYPLGQPGMTDYSGTAITVKNGIKNFDTQNTGEKYPWTAPGSGFGLDKSQVTGPQLAKAGGKATRRQVIGMALYQKAVQMSQEYSEIRTAEGNTRGKFTEMVMDVKYDCWVDERYSCSIIPIVDAKENTGSFGIPVKNLNDAPVAPAVTGITATPAAKTIAVGETFKPVVQVTGKGAYDNGWRVTDDGSGHAKATADGVIIGINAGSTVVTFTAVGDAAKTAKVTVTVA